MRKLIAFLFLACAGALQAQSPPQFPSTGANSQSSLQLEILRRAVRENNDLPAQHAIAVREEEIARSEFCVKANRFVALWLDFASRLNDKQTFDAKLAKKLAKAFHELETSDGWPVREAHDDKNH